ncbi:MAG: hypothetical protein PHT59_00210 [Candidatus Omnitrophica bacterium]|nr:hypothetical protein [Candidatus Omnitrophota bacterium]
MKKRMFIVLLGALLIYTTAAFAQTFVNFRLIPEPISSEMILLGAGVLSFLYPTEKRTNHQEKNHE